MRSIPGLSVVLALVVLALAGCTSTTSAEKTEPPLAGLPSNTVMYIIGDSWSAGFAADPYRTAPIIAAATLGWTPQTNAVSGTGYAHVTTPGTLTFQQRAAAIPEGQPQQLVLLQGSVNDKAVPAAVERKAVRETIALVRSRFEDAHIVMLGPGPYSIDDLATVTRLDGTLAQIADAAGIPYISMLREQWITASNIGYVIDPATLHPTVAGDAYLGGRLADALQDLR